MADERFRNRSVWDTAEKLETIKRSRKGEILPPSIAQTYTALGEQQ